VITNLKPYPAYKDSGVEWLGQVPAHWKVRRMKAAVHHINEQTSTRNDEDLYIALEHVESWTGRLLVPSGDPQFDSQVRRFRVGDVLFGKLRPYLAKVARPKQRGVCVGEFFVLRARPVVIPAYLEVVLRSAPAIDFINSSTYGAKMPRADWAFVGAMLFPLPPLPEQTAIARFLDYMERRIRRVIRARQRRIKLLEEYKQSLIHQVVTGKCEVRRVKDETGAVRLELIPRPPETMKDSGIQWLGQVPAHWEVRRLKTVCRLAYGDSLPDSARSNGEVPVLGSNGQVGLHTNSNTLAPCIVIGRKGSFGKVTYSAISVFAIDTTFFVDRRQSLENLRWLYYLLGWLHLDDVARDSAIPGLNRDEAYQRTISIPPLLEQVAIVEYLDMQTARIDAAIGATRREIELLREYRTRLIADVVTGKVDVREIAPHLPEEPPEEDVALIDSDEINDSETAEDDSAAEALSVEEVEP